MYHGHTHYYQVIMLEIVPEAICFCRSVVAMAMVVMGGIKVSWPYTLYHVGNSIVR